MTSYCVTLEPITNRLKKRSLISDLGKPYWSWSGAQWPEKFWRHHQKKTALKSHWKRTYQVLLAGHSAAKLDCPCPQTLHSVFLILPLGHHGGQELLYGAASSLWTNISWTTSGQKDPAPLCPGTLLSWVSFPRLHCRGFTQEKLGFSPPFSWSHTHSSLFTSSSLIGKLLPQKGRNLAFHLASSNPLFNALYPLLQVLGSDRLYFPQWPQQYFSFTGLSPIFRWEKAPDPSSLLLWVRKQKQ